jgi:uncharacterized membrane protein YedE/YeeE
MGRALIGGALIGLGATLFWVSTGRTAGVSGLLRGVIREARGRAEGLAFLLGLVIAGALASAPTAVRQPMGWLLGAGLLVGFGTRLGGGCTSGHGVCGISRFSVRSIVATVTFVVAGIVTVFVVGRLAPWTLPR